MTKTPTKKLQEHIVNNFLSSLDMDMPIFEHFQNCLYDAELYRWPSSVIVAIFMGIEDAYKNKESKDGHN